jgi:RES domain-containing protein
VALPPVAAIRQFDTSRLIPSRFADAESSVLAAIADDDQHLAELFELDNATNQRLVAEHGGLAGIGVDELVFGIPNFRIINAAYTYARPEGSRFNDGERGAWYCSFEIRTALEEVIFHKSVEYAEIDRFDDVVTYQEFLADFNAAFHDLRGDTRHKSCLSPSSYIKSQALALRLLASESLGVVYPSVRHPGGTNLACFRPALVGNVRKGRVFRLTWNGPGRPSVKNISGAEAKRRKKA